MRTDQESSLVPFAAVWRTAGSMVIGIPVEVHVAGSDEQAHATLLRFQELVALSTQPSSEPFFRLACAADAYLNELNTTISRHGSAKIERRLTRLAFAIGTTIERSRSGTNFEVEPSALPRNAVVVVVQHGHTVCMTSISCPSGDAIALTGPRAALCVVAGQRLGSHPGDLDDLNRYFGVSGVVVARAPSSAPC